MAGSRQVRRAAARKAGAPQAAAPARRAYAPERMALARQARLAAMVMAAVMIAWVGLNLVGGRLGLAGRYAILIDLAALAAFIWALAVTFRVWRKGRELDREGR